MRNVDLSLRMLTGRERNVLKKSAKISSSSRIMRFVELIISIWGEKRNPCEPGLPSDETMKQLSGSNLTSHHPTPCYFQCFADQPKHCSFLHMLCTPILCPCIPTTWNVLSSPVCFSKYISSTKNWLTYHLHGEPSMVESTTRLTLITTPLHHHVHLLALQLTSHCFHPWVYLSSPLDWALWEEGLRLPILLPLGTRKVWTMSKFYKWWINYSFKRRSSIFRAFVCLSLTEPGMD